MHQIYCFTIGPSPISSFSDRLNMIMGSGGIVLAACFLKTEASNHAHDSIKPMPEPME